MNRKGQALVEFILILPIFLMILFVIVDFGVVFNHKNSLENQSTDIVRMYQNGTTIDKIKETYPDIEIKINTDQKYSKITITEDVKLITPGAYRILGNPFAISVERVVPNE